MSLHTENGATYAKQNETKIIYLTRNIYIFLNIQLGDNRKQPFQNVAYLHILVICCFALLLLLWVSNVGVNITFCRMAIDQCKNIVE